MLNLKTMTGEELKKLRLERGWTQTELAEKIGTMYNVISGWENGKHKISNVYVKILRSVFK